jgi:hypothetical protein
MPIIDMKKDIVLLLLGFFLFSCTGSHVPVSPNGKIKVLYTSLDNESPALKVMYVDGTVETEVLEIPELGVVTENGHGKGLKLNNISAPTSVKGSYTMLTGKKKLCSYDANEYVYTFSDSLNQELKFVLRLYNDGLAFRYEIPQLEETLIKNEQTVYRIPEGKNRWIQTYDMGYEKFYPLTTSGDGKKRQWGYPALVQASENVYMLISEAGIEKMHSASFLNNEIEETDYKVTLDKNEKSVSGDWFSPWRVIMVGSLADIVESTLITDVSPENRIGNTDWIQPGSVSWIYWAYNHGSKDYQIVKKYIDMAVEMSLPYVLIDAEWDEMSNGGTVEDALNYAKQCGVKPLIWYNSSTGWIKEWGAPGPHERLNDPVKREQEFAWLEKMGVVGVKIDFFAGDQQETMEYYMDLMESAAKYHLMVNFHGATIPRGWQRTYPHLMTIEAVYGAEWYNNKPVLTTKAASHNSTLPFTRNVIGSMDYTPCTFSDSQHPHITTHAHELALTVLYESALQHLADRPESYLAQPADVQRFLTELPTTWDETRLVSGYPGVSVAIARCKDGVWYVGGLNGTEAPMDMPMDWSFLSRGNYGLTLFLDSGDKENPWKIETLEGDKDNLLPELNLQPRGGFVAVVKRLK